MNADGARLSKSRFNDVRDESSSWSPDGRMIASHRNFDLPHQQPYELGNDDLYTMRADGSHQLPLG